MKLLCHRGIWFTPEEKNTERALGLAFAQGLGIETDVRDCDGQLVVSHDAPLQASAMSLDTLLASYHRSGRRPPLALNIKADGLHQPLLDKLQQWGVTNYFVFDMSVPDTLGYRRLGMPWAARLSEYESGGPLPKEAGHIWLDAFEGQWYDMAMLSDLLQQGKQVAVVSPELHRREYGPLWAALRELGPQPRLLLCTDLVEQALEVFDVERD